MEVLDIVKSISCSGQHVNPTATELTKLTFALISPLHGAVHLLNKINVRPSAPLLITRELHQS
jgi:hypothetical protein